VAAASTDTDRPTDTGAFSSSAAAEPANSAGWVRLSYLAPDLTQAILDGRQPRDLTAEKLLAHSRLPLAWHDQRIVLGF
jgi:site-specific DNA recombinase